MQIGVGKNVVRAIRFWGLAAKLITEDPQHLGRRETSCVPTRRGRALFGEGRWDPYMEDPGTLWLLLAPKSQLPVWWLAFNEFNAVEFAAADLEAAVSTLLDAASEWAKPHEHSLNKDTSALRRTYAPADRTRRARLDDMLDCPLREFNLMGAPTLVDPSVWFGLMTGKLTLLGLPVGLEPVISSRSRIRVIPA